MAIPEVDITKFPKPLPLLQAILFLIGEIFFPGIATIILSLFQKEEGKKFDISFLVIGVFQILLIPVVAGVIWAWSMGIATFYASLCEAKKARAAAKEAKGEEKAKESAAETEDKGEEKTDKETKGEEAV